ncbi:hypothetical protein MHBO_003862 [Bonamia ostreae]|uniref:Uncharacterized protein n=1 Tax=Bonamia ostreae TaxID=126728 RepID=A0ABV2ARQ6_9EUKA
MKIFNINKSNNLVLDDDEFSQNGFSQNNRLSDKILVTNKFCEISNIFFYPILNEINENFSNKTSKLNGNLATQTLISLWKMIELCENKSKKEKMIFDLIGAILTFVNNYEKSKNKQREAFFKGILFVLLKITNSGNFSFLVKKFEKSIFYKLIYFVENIAKSVISEDSVIQAAFTVSLNLKNMSDRLNLLF